LLETQSLSVDYGGVHALRDVSVSVPDKSIVAVIGANGAGKSTLLKAIAGLVRPGHGVVCLDGEDITRLRPHDRLDRGIVLCPEGRRLFPELTVYENLRMGAYRVRDRRQFRERIDFLHQIFPRVAERGKQVASSLSGGEQQMVAIARGLMSAPSILIIDELSLGLAPVVVYQLFQTLKKLKEGGLTILLVEQNVHLALAVSDYAYVIAEGRLFTEGAPQKLAAMPEIRKAYLGL
jgi:branched-chain amino acid transport system ATP-binding protein